MAKEVKFEVIEDFGTFGEGEWKKHLTLTKWNDGEPKFDIRAWNEDMSKCGRGITLTKAEVDELKAILQKM